MKRKLCIVILLFCISKLSFSQSDSVEIYDHTIPTLLADSTISMEHFRGKKILLVNSASAADSLNQFLDLQRLYDQFRSELVIIMSPSNSFNNQPGDAAYIRNLYRYKMDSTFIITAKIQVAVSGIHDLYDWLARNSENGVMDAVIRKDWTKILINGQGRIVGYFSSQVTPLNAVIISAINQN
jgi:glutathione peroxidase